MTTTIQALKTRKNVAGPSLRQLKYFTLNFSCWTNIIFLKIDFKMQWNRSNFKKFFACGAYRDRRHRHHIFFNNNRGKWSKIFARALGHKYYLLYIICTIAYAEFVTDIDLILCFLKIFGGDDPHFSSKKFFWEGGGLSTYELYVIFYQFSWQPFLYTFEVSFLHYITDLFSQLLACKPISNFSS